MLIVCAILLSVSILIQIFNRVWKIGLFHKGKIVSKYSNRGYSTRNYYFVCTYEADNEVKSVTREVSLEAYNLFKENDYIIV